MAKIITVQGANSNDETNRHNALEKLNELDTIVIERLAELSSSQKAQNYFKSSLLYAVVKGYLK